VCGILDEIVESEGDTAKIPKSDKQRFRVWIRNADRQQTNKGEENFKEHVIAAPVFSMKGVLFSCPYI
jgi:hypothetical protein